MQEYKSVILAIVISVVVIAAGVLFYYYVLDREPQPEATPEVAEPQPMSNEEPAEEIIEPLDVVLDESDDIVRTLVSELSSHPTLVRWLMTDNMIRKFVAAVDNIANGESPRAHIGFFEPSGDFRVIKRHGERILDPRNFRRYDLIKDVFTSFDTEGFVKVYKQLTPAIQEAYRDLGYQEADFHSTLNKAFLELYKVPVVEDSIKLKEEVVTYQMLDPRLERLTPAQKHLLRMGPENVRAIQAKLEEMAQALGFEK
jgi:hypothetical protein